MTIRNQRYYSSNPNTDPLLSPVEHSILTKMRAKVAIKKATDFEEQPLEWNQTNQHEKDALSYYSLIDNPTTLDIVVKQLVKAEDDRLKQEFLKVIPTDDLLQEINKRITYRGRD